MPNRKIWVDDELKIDFMKSVYSLCYQESTLNEIWMPRKYVGELWCVRVRWEVGGSKISSNKL